MKRKQITAPLLFSNGLQYQLPKNVKKMLRFNGQKLLLERQITEGFNFVITDYKYHRSNFSRSDFTLPLPAPQPICLYDILTSFDEHFARLAGSLSTAKINIESVPRLRQEISDTLETMNKNQKTLEHAEDYFDTQSREDDYYKVNEVCGLYQVVIKWLITLTRSLDDYTNAASNLLQAQRRLASEAHAMAKPSDNEDHDTDPGSPSSRKSKHGSAAA